MLRSRSDYIAPLRARGFSLIEMMISITIGMIVAAGAVMLIVAIDRSNSESIQTTRINQELRALSSVIADEIKRARHLHDPVASVGQGATSNGTFDFVDTSTAGCFVYGYQDSALYDGVANEEYLNNFESIYLKTTGGVGSVMFAKLSQTGTTNAPLGCTDSANTGKGVTPIALTSPQLNVTGLTFSCVTLAGGNVTKTSTNSASCNQIDVSITAKLLSGDTTTSKISHTYVQQVFIRSGAVKTT
jgi:Tfp pilus assembly protein PilW